MECTQAEAFEQYIRDLRVVRSISRPSFPEGKAPAAVLDEIQTNALRCNTLMRQNEALLAQFVYDRDPASLTEEDIQGLSAFAGRLFNYANSEDMGVAFKVHQLLLAAARSRENVPMIVRELYYTGITLHYMNVRDEGTGINLLGDAIQVYFTEAAEYMSRYEQLDRNTRQYLIRCVGNTRLGMSRGTHAESCRYLERFRRAMDIIQSAHYHALDPEFPWESYIYSMHMDRMTLLTHLRQEEDPRGGAAGAGIGGIHLGAQEEVQGSGCAPAELAGALFLRRCPLPCRGGQPGRRGQDSSGIGGKRGAG